MIYYFETIRCDDFEVFNLQYHNKRISKTIGLNINLQEYIYPPTDHLLKCKVIYSSNGIEKILYDKYTPREIQTLKIIEADSYEYKYKYLNRDTLNSLYEKKGIADEIIIIKNGYITDTSIANIAILKDNRWITPSKPLLEGTMRDKLLENELIYEGQLTVKDLKQSKKLALMNAMIGFKELTSFNIIY